MQTVYLPKLTDATVENGHIDLSGVDFSSRGTVALNGRWNAEWITPPERVDASSNTATYPGTWRGSGYIRYSAVLEMPDTSVPLAILMSHIFSSYRLTVNGVVVGEAGRVGPSRERYRTGYSREVVVLPRVAGTTLVELEAANFHHDAGGPFEPMLLGQFRYLQSFIYRKRGADMLITGFLVIAGIVHLFYFSYRREELSAFACGAFSLLYGLRIGFTGEYWILPLLSWLPWEFTASFSVLSLLGCSLLITYFLYYLLDDRILTVSLPVIWVVHAAFALVVLVTDRRVFGPLMKYYHFFEVGMICLGVLVLIRAMAARKQGAVTFFIGFSFFGLGALNDVLAIVGILRTPFVSHAGIFLLVMSQTIILARRYALALSKEEAMTARLNGLIAENREYQHELERRVAERTESLKTMTEEAIRANRSKSRFLANISHELRTPLNGIIGFAELSAAGEAVDDNDGGGSGLREAIFRESNHMLTLINQLLDFSKIEDGKFILEYHPFDPRDLLFSLGLVFRDRTEKKKLTFHVEYDDAIPEILYGDSLRLRQVLTNLTDNAIKFTDTGGVEIDARLLSETQDTVMLQYEIRDTGIGIPKESQAAIFESFVQADDSTTRKYGGSGLGITIAKQLVELMHGEIDVESAPGEGSTFRFTAEFERTENQRGETVPSTLETTEIEVVSLSGKTILLAEDYDTNRAVVAGHLLSVGATVLEATNGSEAIEQWNRRKADLILMDIHMPILDGYGAVRRIRETDREVPILALTAAAFEDDLRKCRQAGMNGVITKPIHKAGLLARISAALEGRFDTPPRQAAGRTSRGGAFSMEKLVELFDGDGETAVSIARDFLRLADTHIGRIPDLLEAGDIREAHRLIHGLKGGALNIGAATLAEQAARLESRLKANISQDADDHLSAIRSIIDDLQGVLNEPEISEN